MTDNANYYLDITSDACPMTFVRTKLLVERMAAGETLEVRLKGSEPLLNVPKSVAELGHHIISLTPEEAEGTTGIHRLLIRKAQ
ncbi:MAG: sulfurtransferase TusA family protein [Rhodospirillaceae bacterium]|nr:sulfurtransferase TusA family protein [Rhodospirillales bacterium]